MPTPSRTNARVDPARYDALERAQEILTRAHEAGYFADCWESGPNYSWGRWNQPRVSEKAARLLGAEFDDVEAIVEDRERIRAVPGVYYRPRARASAASWLPEEET